LDFRDHGPTPISNLGPPSAGSRRNEATRPQDELLQSRSLESSSGRQTNARSGRAVLEPSFPESADLAPGGDGPHDPVVEHRSPGALPPSPRGVATPASRLCVCKRVVRRDGSLPGLGRGVACHGHEQRPARTSGCCETIPPSQEKKKDRGEPVSSRTKLVFSTAAVGGGMSAGHWRESAMSSKRVVLPLGVFIFKKHLDFGRPAKKKQSEVFPQLAQSSTG